MLGSRMGPQFDGSTAAGMQQPPLSAPPVRNRNVSGSSTSSLPTNSADTAFPFHLISQIGDVTNNAVLNSALLALGQQQQLLGQQKQQQQQQPQQLFKLDRSVSEPNAQNQQKLHPSQGKNVVNPSRYKTEVCRPFNENGFCKYGDKCQFAHGDQELRGLPRHPKYKTELCRTFHTIGFCPYGPRCHFIHSEDECKLVEISQMKQHQAAQQAANEMAQQAANLQVQHQAIQAQLKALVSQFHQNQLVTQLGSPATSRPCDRPKLFQSISVHPLMRDDLGSAGDTPPESMSGSPPVLSPVFTDDTVSDILSDSLSSVSGFVTPPVCSDLNSSFNLSAGESSPIHASPVKQQQQQQRLINQQQIGLENITATFQGLSLSKGDQHQQPPQPVFSPPSSPDSNSDLNSRLPVFSRLGRQN